MTADKKPLTAAHLSLVESLASSPDGKYLASGSFQEVIVWDARTGELRTRLTGFADRVVALRDEINAGHVPGHGGFGRSEIPGQGIIHGGLTPSCR